MPRYSHLLLDLDDTLYPSNSGVWEAVLARIQRFIETRLSLTPQVAEALRSRYLAQFGTTLAGLQAEFDVDAMEYLDYVHDVPIPQLVQPDPALKSMLLSIPIPCIVFTNAYLPHADSVLNCLGVHDEIDQVIDILALEFKNKPLIEAYDRLLDLISAEDPSKIVFADDREANLDPAARIQMITVMVGKKPMNGNHRHIRRITDLTQLLPGLLMHPVEG